jgi:protein pelota
MRILGLDRKTGAADLSPENMEDLWHLCRVVDKGDVAEGRTMRSVRIGAAEEKKPVRLKIRVEGASFSKYGNSARITGVILEGEPEEFVQRGKYHTFDVEPGMKIRITKTEWKGHHLAILKQAERDAKRPRVGILVMDDEKALPALLMGYGVEYGNEIHSNASKSGGDYEQKMGEYFTDIIRELESKQVRWIVAGPGFHKDNFKKYVSEKAPKLMGMLHFEGASNSERSAVQELLKRGVVSAAAGEARIEKETALVESLIMHINKEDGLACYGKAATLAALDAHAAEVVLVCDSMLKDAEIERLAGRAERECKLEVLSGEGEPGEKLAGLGGICALLRFRMD